MVTEGFAPVDGAQIFYREHGRGTPLVVAHGGPDMDHRYLLPDFDRLGDCARLVLYDQCGRGQSRGEVELEGLGIDRYVRDLEGLRRHLRLDPVAVLGHSWGGLVAMHYALAHFGHVSHLILLNSAPASNEGLTLMRAERRRRWAAHQERLDELTPAYERGDPEAVTEAYRIDFGTTFKRREDLDRLDLTYTREQIASGRRIEAKLMEGLIWAPGFTLVPQLRALRVPTLVIHGELDFIPRSCSEEIANAIPGARLVALPDSGHFSYIDAGPALQREIRDFLATGNPAAGGR